MQTTEQNLDQVVSPEAPEPEQEADKHLSPEEVDEIFRLAEAEIQPLLKKWRRDNFLYGVAEVLCFLTLLFSLGSIVWQCITYPHTLVILYTKAIPASTTATLELATRTLAPITITRSATIPTSGTGHQDARVATGTLIFYNGSSTPQYVPVGSVFTGADGVKIDTDYSVTIPAANLPAIGSIAVSAHAVLAGSKGNIAPFAITIALSPDLKVRNEAPFTHGQDARKFKAVAKADLATLTSTVEATIAQALITSFSLQPEEQDVLTNCHETTSATHQIGDEGQTVTLTSMKTCSAVAYNGKELKRLATAAFTRTRPKATYHIVRGIQITVKSVTPLTVTLRGKWAYTFSQDYQDFLAGEIQGDSPAKAYLLKTGVISYASVPNTLPSAGYINFLVLVG